MISKNNSGVQLKEIDERGSTEEARDTEDNAIGCCCLQERMPIITHLLLIRTSTRRNREQSETRKGRLFRKSIHPFSLNPLSKKLCQK